MSTMMSTMRATMDAPTPTPTWASRGNVDCVWLSYCTLPREKFRFPIFTWNKGGKDPVRNPKPLLYEGGGSLNSKSQFSASFTHSELGQTVHAILLLSSFDWGLLGRRLAVQVALCQGLHQTQAITYPSLHLTFGDGSVQVLPLQAKTWYGFSLVALHETRFI